MDLDKKIDQLTSEINKRQLKVNSLLSRIRKLENEIGLIREHRRDLEDIKTSSSSMDLESLTPLDGKFNT